MLDQIPQRSPNARLEFFDWGIRLHIRTPLGWAPDRYEIRFEELAGAGLVDRKIRSGLRLRIGVLPQPVTFMTVNSREILGRLEQRGVPVEREIASLDRGPLEVIADHPRALLVCLCAAAAFLVFAFVTFIIPAMIGAQMTFQTLRGDLARVHLPPGYHLIAEHRAGTNCHEECSLTQTWTWAPAAGRSTGGACSDAFHALSAAYAHTESNSPVRAGVACDYFASAESLFHPGQGKPGVEVTVKPSQAAAAGFTVKLTASYE